MRNIFYLSLLTIALQTTISTKVHALDSQPLLGWMQTQYDNQNVWKILTLVSIGLWCVKPCFSALQALYSWKYGVIVPILTKEDIASGDTILQALQETRMALYADAKKSSLCTSVYNLHMISENIVERLRQNHPGIRQKEAEHNPSNSSGPKWSSECLTGLWIHPQAYMITDDVTKQLPSWHASQRILKNTLQELHVIAQDDDRFRPVYNGLTVLLGLMHYNLPQQNKIILKHVVKCHQGLDNAEKEFEKLHAQLAVFLLRQSHARESEKGTHSENSTSDDSSDDFEHLSSPERSSSKSSSGSASPKISLNPQAESGQLSPRASQAMSDFLLLDISSSLDNQYFRIE